MGRKLNYIHAKVIEDSINIDGIRATTLLITLPRIILPEMNTHRVFSRNVASSRAKSYQRSKQDMLDKPYYPIEWHKKHRAMNGKKVTSQWTIFLANFIYSCSLRTQVFWANQLDRLGLHKEHCNRLIEPYMHIDYLVTSTEWKNFHNQRDHEDAHPAMQEVSKQIQKLMSYSEPILRGYKEWHLPFVTEEEREQYDINTLLRLSSARCARTSYSRFVKNFDEDLTLFTRLIDNPPHMSPFEHQLTVSSSMGILNPSNIRDGWVQYRKFLEHTNADIEKTDTWLERW